MSKLREIMNQSEHWAYRKAGCPKNETAVLFHMSRTIFVVIGNIVHVCAEPITHAEWFEKEGWISGKDDSFIDNNVRGYVAADGVYSYVGHKAIYTPLVEQVITNPFVLWQLVVKLNLNLDLPVYAGTKHQKTGGKWPPDKTLGTIKCLVENKEPFRGSL